MIENVVNPPEPQYEATTQMDLSLHPMGERAVHVIKGASSPNRPAPFTPPNALVKPFNCIDECRSELGLWTVGEQSLTRTC